MPYVVKFSISVFFIFKEDILPSCPIIIFGDLLFINIFVTLKAILVTSLRVKDF